MLNPAATRCTVLVVALDRKWLYSVLYLRKHRSGGLPEHPQGKQPELDDISRGMLVVEVSCKGLLKPSPRGRDSRRRSTFRDTRSNRSRTEKEGNLTQRKSLL